MLVGCMYILEFSFLKTCLKQLYVYRAVENHAPKKRISLRFRLRRALHTAEFSESDFLNSGVTLLTFLRFLLRRWLYTVFSENDF